MTRKRLAHQSLFSGGLILLVLAMFTDFLGRTTHEGEGCWRGSGYLPPGDLRERILLVSSNGRYEKRELAERGTWTREGSRFVLHPDRNDRSEVFILGENPRILRSEVTDGIDYLPCKDGR